MSTTRADLVGAQALLEAIFAAAPVGVAFLDDQLRFVRVNAKLAELNGMSPEAHVGRTPRELFPMLPLDEMEALWRRMLLTGEPVVNHELSGETAAAPGKKRFWREDWYPVRVDGAIVGIAAIVREVTDEKRAEELQRLLVGIVGHDLRNPLSVITSATHLLLRGVDSEDRQRELVAKIDRSAARIDALARDLLDYTLISRNGGIPVQRGRTNLQDVVDAAADEVLATYPGAVIDSRGDAELHGEWDAARLQQLVGNLLSNAAKYGANGEPITVRWSGDGELATLTVHNRGVPIPADRLPHVFDGVWLGPEKSRQGGIGLGLFISREIVRAHGGTVDVASSDGDGTTFRVRLRR